MRIGLRSKIVLSFLLLFLPILVFLQADYQDDYLLLTDNLLADQADSAKAIAALVDATFDEVLADAQTYAADPDVLTFDPKTVVPYLRRVQQFYPAYEDIALYDAAGDLVASTEFEGGIQGISVADLDYFQQALATGRPVVSGVVKSKIAGNLAVVVASPVPGLSGSPRGLFVFVLNASFFPERLKDFGLDKGLDVLLSDKTGVLAFSSLKSDPPREIRTAADFEPVRAGLEGQSSRLRSIMDMTGIERMITALPTPKHGWVVAVSRSVDGVVGPARADFFSDAAVNAGILLMFAVFALALTNAMLVRPIETVKYHLARFGQGDLSGRIDIRSGDELEDLAHAFNETVEQFQQRTSEREALLAEVTRGRQQMGELARMADKRAAELESVISSIADGVAIFNSEGAIDSANEAAETVLGMPVLKELNYREFPEYFHLRRLSGEPVDPEGTATARALRGETQVNLELLARKSDGTDAYIGVSAAPIRDSLGGITGGVLVIRDISQRILAQRATEEAERRANFLAEASAFFTSARRSDEITGFLARRAIEVFGDLCGVFLINEQKNQLDLVAIEDSDPEHKRRIRRMLRLKPLHPGEWTVGKAVEIRRPILVKDVESESEKLYSLKPDDRELAKRLGLISQLAVPLIARDNVFGVFNVCTSVHSGRRLNEEDLNFAIDLSNRAATALDNVRLYAQVEAQRTFFQAVLDNVPASIAVLDEDLEILQANPAFLRNFLPEEYQSDEAKGMPVIDLVRRKGWRLDYQFLKKTGKAGKAIVIPEFPATDPQGKQTFWAITGIPFPGPEEEKSRLMVVASDMTQQVEARLKVEDIDRAKDQFLSIVSHELRSPLTSAKGYAQMLLRKIEDQSKKADEKRVLSLIVDQVNRMAAMIEELLDVSRIQMGRLGLEKSRFDLVELVRKTVDRLQVTTSKHHIRLFAQGPIEMEADRNRIEQVVANMITNAIKYSPSGGDIEVSVTGRGAIVEFHVKDHGIGISREARSRIFEQFYQAGSGKRDGGLGLGMFISRGIVEQHGGRIWFDSKLGEGSTFYFAIPVK